MPDITQKKLGLIGAAIVLASLLLTWALIESRPTPAIEPRVALGPMVETTDVARADARVSIVGYGTVEPRVRANIIPQVSGRIEWVHANMITGGFVSAGDTLLQIDKRDYQLALNQIASRRSQAEAAQQTAQVQINEAQVRLNDALHDMERIRQLVKVDAARQRELEKAQVTHELAQAQLQTAQAQLASAGAKLNELATEAELAQMQLERTQITAPFDAVVLWENVDVGQYVIVNQSVAELYGTDAVEIPVPLQDSDLAWFETIPVAHPALVATMAEHALPIAMVSADFLGQKREWEGRVARTRAEVDSRSRMVPVVVRVEKPFAGIEQQQPPLIPGMFVKVTIRGREIPDVITLPHRALRDESSVWVIDEGRLRVKPVTIVYRDTNYLYITEGIDTGDQVILSSLDVVTDGMLVRGVQ